MQFSCSQCSTVLRVADGLGGQSVRCPSCQLVQRVPGAARNDLPAAEDSADSSDPFAPSTDPYAGSSSQPFGSGQSSMPYTQATSNPYASPSAVAPMSPVGDGIMRPTAVDFGDIISHAWSVWKANLGVLVGATAITFGISMGFGIVTSVIEELGRSKDAPVLLVLGSILNMVSSLVNLLVGIGMARICLNAARRRPVQVSMLFGGADSFMPVLGGTILFMLGMVGGLLLLIIPGLIFALLAWTYYYLIVDRQCGVLESFSRAFEMGKLNWGTSLVMSMMSMLMFFAGLLALVVGLLFSTPLVGVMFATAYIMMKGERMPNQSF